MQIAYLRINFTQAVLVFFLRNNFMLAFAKVIK